MPIQLICQRQLNQRDIQDGPNKDNCALSSDSQVLEEADPFTKENEWSLTRSKRKVGEVIVRKRA